MCPAQKSHFWFTKGVSYVCLGPSRAHWIFWKLFMTIICACSWSCYQGSFRAKSPRISRRHVGGEMGEEQTGVVIEKSAKSQRCSDAHASAKQREGIFHQATNKGPFAIRVVAFSSRIKIQPQQNFKDLWWDIHRRFVVNRHKTIDKFNSKFLTSVFIFYQLRLL